MAGNRKPRKRYRPREIHNFIFYEDQIDETKAIFEDAALLAQIAVPTGKCTFQDVAKIRDAFNFAKVILICDEKVLNSEFVQAASAAFDSASQAFGAYYRRGIEAGALKLPECEPDESVRFVAKGDEIRAIQEAFSYITPLIQNIIETTPMTAIKYWAGMKQFLEDISRGEPGRVAVDFADIKKVLMGKPVNKLSLTKYSTNRPKGRGVH